MPSVAAAVLAWRAASKCNSFLPPPSRLNLPMTQTLDQLIADLRAELTHYGEMLALLDVQQESAINRLADERFTATTAIQNLAAVIQSARRQREQSQRALACQLAVTETSTFVELIPLLPSAYRPLAQTLVDENNSLLRRVQQRARQ